MPSWEKMNLLLNTQNDSQGFMVDTNCILKVLVYKSLIKNILDNSKYWNVFQSIKISLNITYIFQIGDNAGIKC